MSVIFTKPELHRLFLNLEYLGDTVELATMFCKAIDDGTFTASQVFLASAGPFLQAAVINIARFIYTDQPRNESVEDLFGNDPNFPQIIKDNKDALISFRNAMYAHNGSMRKDFKNIVKKWADEGWIQKLMPTYQAAHGYLVEHQGWPFGGGSLA